MSVQPIPDPELDDLYCDSMDVASYFDKYDAFDTDTDPSELEVIRRIEAETDWVDSHTGHAWRPRRVENEYISLGGYTGQQTYYWRAGSPLKLQKRDIRVPFDENEGDKLEVWEGGGWKDWVSDPNKEYGRDGEYWVEQPTGMLYIYRRQIFFRRHKEIRVTYRYGKDKVPPTIRDVVAMRVAAHFLESQQYRVTTPGNEDAPDATSVAETWREKAENDIERFVEMRSLGQ